MAHPVYQYDDIYYMNYVVDFDSFILEKESILIRRELIFNIVSQFPEINPYLGDAKFIIESGIFDQINFNESLNEESLIQKMKSKFDNAVSVAKEKGKKVLTDTQETILKLGGNIVNVIKLIIDKLKEWTKSTWESAKSIYDKAAASKVKDLEDNINKKSEEYKNKLITEVKNFKSISSATIKWATGGFIKDTASAAQQAVKTDESFNRFELLLLTEINQLVKNKQLDFTDILYEGGDSVNIPFVSAIAHKMHHIPPFSLLDKVKSAAEKVAGGFLNKISYYATELAGAPGPYEFVALAALIGIISEVKFKGVAKHAILHAVPGLGTVASIISNIAMGLAVIAVIETLLKKD